MAPGSVRPWQLLRTYGLRFELRPRRAPQSTTTEPQLANYSVFSATCSPRSDFEIGCISAKVRKASTTGSQGFDSNPLIPINSRQ